MFPLDRGETNTSNLGKLVIRLKNRFSPLQKYLSNICFAHSTSSKPIKKEKHISPRNIIHFLYHYLIFGDECREKSSKQLKKGNSSKPVFQSHIFIKRK